MDLTQSEEISVPTVAIESQKQPTAVVHYEKRWTPLTCGFCYGNPACGSAEPYKNPASLRRHLRHIQLAPLNNANEFPLTCPFPQYATTLTTIAHVVNARYADSASPFPHLRSLSPYNPRIKAEAGTESHDPLMLSIEEHKVKDPGQSENYTSDDGSREAKCEETKVQSVEADEVKMASLRLASADVSEQKTAGNVDGDIFRSIETLLRADSERRNSEVYQQFLESYGIVTRMAAALCSHWSPDTWFIKQEIPSMEQNQQLEAFCAEFLDCLKVMQSSLDRNRRADRSDNALVQAIRRFLRHLFQILADAVHKVENGLETPEDPHLKTQIAHVDDLVHLLGDVLARMIMVAKKDMIFAHQVDAGLKIQTAIAVPPRLQGSEFPQNLLLPQFVTGDLIVANADFL